MYEKSELFSGKSEGMIAVPRDDDKNIILINPLPKHLKCALCSKLMRNPLQTIRGELACETCYFEGIGSSGICPIDGGAISPDGYFKDKFKHREIQQLECFCFYKENGCLWIGKVADLEEHQSACSYTPLQCPLCNCNAFDDTHLRYCTALIGRKICIFAEFGCRKQVLAIEDHISHLEEDVLLHSMLQNKHYERIKFENENLKKTLEVSKESSNVKKTEMNQEISNLQRQVLSLSNTIMEIQHRYQSFLNHPSRNLESATTVVSDPKSDRKDELAKLSVTVAAIDKKISDIDLKQQLYENSSHNGKIMWKIDNLNFRMQQAVIGRVTALHSAPCFTAKNGYRFCGRLYLNGDGMGKCTHVSVFFVLMKSEYDNLLEWPFTRRVKFRLINQEDVSRSIEESFLPDRLSSSFQKPSRNMNVAAGCPMFVNKDDLLSDGFVMDNAIFIEIDVT